MQRPPLTHKPAHAIPVPVPRVSNYPIQDHAAEQWWGGWRDRTQLAGETNATTCVSVYIGFNGLIDVGETKRSLWQPRLGSRPQSYASWCWTSLFSGENGEWRVWGDDQCTWLPLMPAGMCPIVVHWFGQFLHRIPERCEWPSARGALRSGFRAGFHPLRGGLLQHVCIFVPCSRARFR